MTREEAIEMWVIPALKNSWNEKKCDEILKALEQEPCTDAISRSEAIKCISGDFYDDGDVVASRIYSQIAHLPTVTPVEKVGHWEYVQYDGNPNIGNWHCSECRAIVNYKPTYNWEKKPYHNYCPNCGAKMEVSDANSD